MALPPLSTAFRRPGTIRGAVAAGLGADVYPDDLKAEQDNARVQVQRDRLNQQAQRTIQTQQQREADRAAKEAEANRKAELSQEVAKATLVKSTLPSTLTTEQRAKIEKDTAEKEGKLKMTAAAAIKAAAEQSPDYGKTTGGVLGWGAKPTPEAQKLREKAARLEDPAAVTEQDLQEARGIMPAPFEELDKLKGTLTADQEARNKRQEADIHLARARARASGIPDDQLDSIAPLPKPGAQAVDEDPRTAHFRAVANSGALDRESSELKTHEQTLLRKTRDLQTIQERKAALQQQLSQGVRGPQSARLYQEFQQLNAAEQAHAADFDADQDAYNNRAKAFEAKRQMHNERIQQLQEPTAAPKTPKLNATEALSRTLPAVDATGAEIGRETSQEDTLEALADTGTKAFWSDPKRAEPVDDVIRRNRTQSATLAVAALQERGKARVEGQRAVRDRIADRVKRGELSVEAAAAEEDRALADYEAQHEADSQAIGSQLGDALDDFQAGKIDSDTLNTVFHAAGSSQTGVEAFKAHLANQRKDDEHVAALSAVMGGDALAGKGGETLDATTRLAVAKGKAGDEWAYAKDVVKAVATIVTPFMQSEDMQLAAGLAITGEGSDTYTKVQQAKAVQAAAELEKLRTDRRTALAQELTKRGVDVADYARLMARAELETLPADVGVLETITARGGAESTLRQKMPFIGGLMQAERILPFAETALKLERGEQPAKEEMDALVEFIRFSQREGTFMKKAVDTISELPAFITELASTSGIASGVKYAGLKGAKAALQKIVTREGRELVAKELAKWTAEEGRNKIGKRLALGLGGEALRLPFASAGRITAGYTRDTALQGVQLSADEGQLLAQIDSTRKGGAHRLADALADSYIENLSERSGGWLGRLVPGGLKAAVSKIAAPLKDKLFKSAVVRALAARNPGMPVSKLGAVLAKANFGSTLEEMGEERVGGLARDLWKGVTGDGWGVTLPSVEDIGVEFVSFMIPGGISAVQTARHFGKLDTDLKASDAESTAHLQSLTDPAATAQRLSSQLSTAANPVQLSEQEVTAARDIIGTVDTTDAMRGIDRTTVDLLQRSEQAMEQGDLSRASRLRSMALEQSRTRTATADGELIRGLQTVREIAALKQQAAGIRENAQEELSAAAGTGGTVPAAEQALVQADQMDMAADRATALVKIARGREASLTTAEQTALQASPIPAVVQEKGGMVITDTGRAELQKVSPAAASYVRQSETERREQLAQSQAQQSAQAVTPQVPAGGVTPTAGATPAASGVGAAQGVAAAPPAGATPATGEWSATGIRGTRVAIPASEAATREEATAKLAQMLKGETLRAGSIQAPKAAAPQNAPANAPVTNPVAQNAPTKDHGKGAAFDADQWRTNAVARLARLAGDQKAFAHATATVAEMQAVLAKVGKVFAGGVEFDNGGPTSGLALDPERQSLAVNIQKFAQQTAGLTGKELADFVESRVMHEVIHAAAVDVLTADQIKDLWKRLGQSEAGQKLAKDVQRAYFAAYEARNEKPPALSNFALGHELLRMCIEDKAFAKRISESQGIDKGFVGELADFLRKIGEWLTARINALPKAERATLESYRDNVIAAMEALGVPGVQTAKAPVAAQEDVTISETPSETPKPTVQPATSAPDPAESTVQPAAKAGTKPAKKAPTQGKDYSAYTEEQQALLRANDDRYASAKRHADAESDAQMRGKLLKAAGMRHAAEFRQITGKLTAKEQQAKDAYEASNHVGKAVSVDGQNGEIVGHAFGRVKVRLSDGVMLTVAPDAIQGPLTDQQEEDAFLESLSSAAPVGEEVVFVAEDLEATPETSNAPNGGQTEGGAVNSPPASETDPGTSSFAPGVEQPSPKKRKKATPKTQQATPTMDAGDKALADAFDGLYANERPVSPFYSKLERVLESKMPGRADAKTIKGIVSNPQNGIKPEELKWSGLLTWLDGQVQPVAKATVLDYLRKEGAVRFEEVRMSGEKITRIVPDGNGGYSAYAGNSLAHSGLTRQQAEQMELRQPGGAYSQYQLPGGENYSEVVLSMPHNQTGLPEGFTLDNSTSALKKWEVYGPGFGRYASGQTKEEAIASFWDNHGASFGKASYTSSHFDNVPNYVAHMRVNERTTQAPVRPMAEIEAAIISQWATNPPKAQNLGSGAPDSAVSKGLITPAEAGVYARHRGFRSGKYYDAKAGLEEGLFIEEIQSDRHQAGREKGYREDKANPFYVYRSTPDGYTAFYYPSKEAAEKDNPGATIGDIRISGEGIPDAPFRKEWPLAMVKRALRDAVATGKDFIGWTVGSVQAERFDLSKQVDSIIHSKNSDGTYYVAAEKGRETPLVENRISVDKLPGLVGKEIAQKIINGEGEVTRGGDLKLSGLDLKVGGEGMGGFYDNILPKEVQKYVKQWGAKVERRDNGLGIHLDPEHNNLPYKANATDSPDNMPYWRVDITPAMSDSVAEGQALFANERPALTHAALPADRREAMMKAAATLVDLKLSTPQELAARLDKLAPGGQLRQYSHAFWKIMQGFNDDLPDMSKDDWAAIYSPPSTEGNRSTAVIAEAAAKLNGEKEGDKQPTVFPKVEEKANDAETAIDDALGELADFLGIDVTEETPAEETKPDEAKKGKIDDFGEKIGGARKDAWKGRGLNVSDLETMTNEEKQSYATRDLIWPAPDYAQWVNDGMPAIVAYQLKRIRDVIAKSPQHSRRGYATDEKKEEMERERKRYVEMIADMRDFFPTFRTYDDWASLRGKLFGNYTWNGDMSLLVGQDHRKSEKRWRNVAFSEMYGRKDREAEEYVLRTGWPLSNEPWMRQFDVREKEIGSTESVKVDGEWKRRTITEPEFYVKPRGKYNILADGFTTRQSAVAWATERYESSRKGKKEGEKVTRPLNANPKREGPDHRRGMDVTGPDLLAAFGFRGGEFGNWTNQADRQQALNSAFDSLHDLARVLNIPPKAISLNGALGIAFGARGKGRASAHYEPSRVVINLTRTSGAGSLAHEWAHAVDDHFGKLGTGMVGKYVSDWAQDNYNPQGLRKPVFTAYQELMTAIGYRKKDAATVIEAANKQIERGRSSFRSWLTKEVQSNEYQMDLVRMIVGEAPRFIGLHAKTPFELLEKLVTSLPNDTKKRRISKALEQNLNYIVRREGELAKAEAGTVTGMEPTEYFTNAKALGAYWVRRHELFARAFESYAQSKLEEAGHKSEYLVHSAKGTKPGEVATAWTNAYPQGRDATGIYAAFGKLFEAIEATTTEKGVTLGATERVAAPDYNAPEFIAKAAKAAKLLVAQYPTPEGFAKRFDGFFKGKADAKLIGRVWALSDAYDPDQAIAWTKILNESRATANEKDEKPKKPEVSIDTTPVDEAAHEAATSPKNDLPEPTEGQKEAGNYTMGHVRIAGMDISIENPAGSERKGTDANGKAWSVTMADHYGYVKGSTGKDGDHIDIFIAPGTPEDFAGPVFVVNQMTDSKDTAEMRPYRRDDGSVGYQAIPERVFDEHKAVMGPSITTAEEARAEYLKNYSPGWKGAGDVVKFDSVAAFREWATAAQRRGAVRQEVADSWSRAEADKAEKAKKPETPATPSDTWSAEDIAVITKLLDLGRKVLFAGNSESTLPTIQSVRGADHVGYGMFKAKGAGWEIHFDGGSAMDKTPGGKRFTVISEVSGTYPYDTEGVRKSLLALAKPVDEAPAESDTTTDESDADTLQQELLQTPRPGSEEVGTDSGDTSSPGERSADSDEDSPGSGAATGVGQLDGERGESDGGKVPGESPGTKGGAKGSADDADSERGGSGTSVDTPALRPGRENYHLTDPEAIVGGGAKTRFRKNKAALETLETIQSEDRDPTDAELDILAAYTGWGALAQEVFRGSFEQHMGPAEWAEEAAWLRQRLGKEDWTSAQDSILNAHYTDPPTFDAIWEMARRMGFNGGRVLEPSEGIGNGWATMPRDLMAASQMTGIEMDPTTSAIAKMLHPRANHRTMPYQDSKTSDNFYDLVYGNWPFSANDKPADARFEHLKATVHNFFFVKALAQTRPGGLVIGITSTGTMDAKGSIIRKYLAARSELVASYRLPTGAFGKYAGTKVVVDLIILKKREKVLDRDAAGEGWIESKKHPTHDFSINEYYLANPQNILGRLDFGHGTTSGRSGMIVHRPDNYEQLLRELPLRLPENIMTPWTGVDRERIVHNTSGERRQGTVVFHDNDLYQVDGESLKPLEDEVKWMTKTPATEKKRRAEGKALIELRRAFTAMLDAQRQQQEGETERKALLELYKAYAATHGPLTNSVMLKNFRKAGDQYALDLYALVEMENGKEVPRAIMLRSIVRRTKLDSTGSIADAYALHRSESLHFDAEAVAKLAGGTTTAQEVIDFLTSKSLLYRQPDGRLTPGEIYLAGNVRQKLREAIAAKEEGVQGMDRSIEALEAVQPADLAYHDITVQMGAGWVPVSDYERFIAETLGSEDADDVQVVKASTGYNVRVSGRTVDKDDARTTWNIVDDAGNSRLHPSRIFQAAMNNTELFINDTVSDGNGGTQLVPNKVLTERAIDLRDRVRAQFGLWLWQDEGRISRLTMDYNEALNSIVNPNFDGSHLRLPGLALAIGKDGNEFTFRQHQLNAVWRGILNRQGVYAHEVGTGKTFTMAGLAIEGKRLGAHRKSLLFAHNANAAAVAADFRLAYPGARVLFIDNLSPANRDRTLRQIATDEWDAVIVPHSLVSRFGLKADTMWQMVQPEIDRLEAEFWDEISELDGVDADSIDLDDSRSLNGTLNRVKNSATAKELASARRRIMSRVAAQIAKFDKPGTVFFEDMGVDSIIVDEAHEFKKISIATRKNVKGLQKSESGRGFNLGLLTDYVQMHNNGKGVHLFTGTPVTNTLNEVFNMMRYTMNSLMGESGINNFDDWYNQFATSYSETEPTSGGTYEEVMRLRGFINVPELARMAGRVFDVVRADDMPEFLPREQKDGMMENPVGRPHKQIRPIVIQPTPVAKRVRNWIRQRFFFYRGLSSKDRMTMQKERGDVPMLMDGDGRVAALDPRLVTPTAEDDPNSKVNFCVRSIMEHYKEDEKTTQMVFVERGAGDYTDAEVPIIPRQYDNDGKPVTYSERRKQFNLLRDMVQKLVDQGVNPSEIAVFADLKLLPLPDGQEDILLKVHRVRNSEQKEATANLMKQGKIRIAFGGTQTMGTGVNAQTYMRAMHHLDVPFMPGELEQRNGRGWRQGNKWNTVYEYRYTVEGSADGKSWGILTNKIKFIERFIMMLQGRGLTRVLEGEGADAAEEEDGASIAEFEQMFSTAAGDPRLILRSSLQKKVDRLQQTRNMHLQFVEQTRRKIEKVETLELPNLRKQLKELEAASALYKEVAGKPFEATLYQRIEGKRTAVKFTDRESFDEAMKRLPRFTAKELIGHFGPFDIHVVTTLSHDYYQLTAGESEINFNSPSAASMEGTLRWMEPRAAKFREDIEAKSKSLDRSKTEMQKPFGREAELALAVNSLAKIAREIKLSPTPAPGWLRFGAPQGSLVYLKEAGKLVAYDLQAHRWDDSGYWAMLEQGDELMPFRYSELLDSSGARIFEDHAHTKPPTVPVVDDTAAAPQAFPGVESALHYEFATRIVIEADGTEVATPRFRTLYQIVRDGFYDPASAAPVRTPRNDSTRLLDVDTAPRGLWRKREKLREILTKLESQKETALRAVRIANVTKTLKRTEEQLLANSEGGLSANIRPALGRGLGDMGVKPMAKANDLAERWWAATTRQQAQAVLENASLAEIQSVAEMLEIKPTQTKGKLIDALVGITGGYADAVAIRGLDAVGPRGPLPDFAARAAESARAKAEFAQRAAERKASTEDKGVKRPVYTGDQNQFNANMAAIALTPGRTAVGSSLPVSQRPATTLSRAMIDQVRALLPAAQRPVGLEEMLNRAENIVSNDGNFEVRKSDPTTIPQALQLILGGANPQFIVNRWAEHRNQVSMGQTTVPTPFSEYAATNASTPRESVLSAYAKLDRTGQGYVRIPDLARASGLPMADVREVLIAMSDRGAAYLTPADEPRNIPADDRSMLVVGPSGPSLYVTLPAAVEESAWITVDTSSDDSLADSAGGMLSFTDVPASQVSAADQKRLAPAQGYLTQDPRTAGKGTRIVLQALAGSVRDGVSVEQRSATQFLKAFEKVTGRTVLFVDTNPRLAPTFQGLSPRSQPDAIIVHARSTRPLLAVIAHEWGHTVARTHPDLYREFQNKALSFLKTDGLRIAADTLLHPSDGRRPYRRQIIKEEIANNLIGDVFLQPEFWHGLRERDPSLLHSLWRSVMEWFYVLSDQMRKSTFGTELMVSDLKGLQAAIADLMHASATLPAESSGLAANERITPNQDADYLAAVEAGDSGNDNLIQLLRDAPESERKAVVDAWVQRNPKAAAEAQRMVDEASRRAGALNDAEYLYHGGNKKKTSFAAGANRSGIGFAYLTDSKNAAWKYALGGGIDSSKSLAEYRRQQLKQLPDREPTVQKLFVLGSELDFSSYKERPTVDNLIDIFGDDRIRNTLEEYGFEYREALEEGEELTDVLSKALEQGGWLQEDTDATASVPELQFIAGAGLLPEYLAHFNKSVVAYNDAEAGGKTYVILDPNQIKSADPVTYDEAGNVIPLSQRFNPASDSILYSTERPLRDDPEMAALLDALNVPFTNEERSELYSRAGFNNWGDDLTEAEMRQLAENARAGSRSYYDLQRDAQTHQAWNDEARAMLARDTSGTIKELVADSINGNLGRNAVKVKAAQLAIPGMMVAAIANKDKQAFRDAAALTYAYDVAGTETARGLAARWKPHQTAEDAHREMLAKMIFTPSATERAKIERAVNRAEKNDKIKALEAEIAKVKAEANDWANAVLRRTRDQTEAATAREREIAKRFQGELIAKFEEAARAERAQAAREVLRLNQELRKVQEQKDKQQIISEANEKRLAEIEQALADMGVTFHDIFVSKEAIVRLRGSALVKNVLKTLNEKERMAIKSRLEGRTDRQIARETGISERSLAGVFSQFDTALKAQISTWVDRGFSIADFEMLDSAGNRVDVTNLIDDQGNLLAANVRAANLTAEEKAARIDGIFSAIVPADKARNSGALKRVTGSQPAAPYGFDISRPEHAVVLARAIARLDSSGADMVYEYWINGLLSGPATHFANLTGNTGNAALEYAIQRPLEAITNAVLFRDAAGASLGEYKSMAKWTQRAFSNAVAFAKTAWETEVSLFDSQWLDKPIQLRGSSGDKGQIERFAIPGKFGRFVRSPSRALQFADEFAKHFFGMLEASAQAHRLARADGLTGKALDDRVEQLVSVPGSPAWLAAVDKAHQLTFTNDLPTPLQRAQDIMHERAATAMGSAAKMLMRFVFPFVRTPYNIFATGMRKTPLGSVRMGWKAGVGLVDAWKGNQAFFESYPKAALAGDIAEQLLAWTTALLLAGAAEGDPDDDKKLLLITGTRSLGDSRGEAQLLNRIRGGETSIIVNGQPVLNYGRIEPFSTIISTVVDAARELKKINGGEPAVKAFENAARNLVDQARSKTFLQGFDGLMQLLDGRVKSMPGAAVKFIVTGAVPNLVRQPLRNIDDFARDSRNAPWYYQALPFGGFAEPLYDLYGRPMEKGENSASRILTGNSNAQVQPRNPADTALDRWNKDNEGDPQQKYYPVNPSVFRYKDAQGRWKDMTAQEIARFRRVAGQNFAQEAIQTFMVPRAPQAEEVRKLRNVKDASYSDTKAALFGGGVPAPMPKRQPPTLKELFGQQLRK